MRLREVGLVPWDWIGDETRTLSEWTYAPTVADFIKDAVDEARIDLWQGEEPPLIINESRATMGVLWDLTYLAVRGHRVRSSRAGRTGTADPPTPRSPAAGTDRRRQGTRGAAAGTSTRRIGQDGGGTRRMIKAGNRAQNRMHRGAVASIRSQRCGRACPLPNSSAVPTGEPTASIRSTHGRTLRRISRARYPAPAAPGRT